MQYQSECLTALKSAVKISKPFEKTFMDTMKLFMAIPDCIKKLQKNQLRSCLFFTFYCKFSKKTTTKCKNSLLYRYRI